MNTEQIISKLRNFLEESTTFVGASFSGMYTMSNECFFAALEHYLETGFNVLDEYSELQYIVWDLYDDDIYYNKEQRNKIYQYLNNENFWNIYSVLSDKEISLLKSKLIRSKNFDDYRESYEMRRKQASIYTSDPKLREQIFNRDGRFCKKCKSTKNLELDHIIPVSKGGKDSEDNLQILCKSCNASKGNK